MREWFGYQATADLIYAQDTIPILHNSYAHRWAEISALELHRGLQCGSWPGRVTPVSAAFGAETNAGAVARHPRLSTHDFVSLDEGWRKS